MIINSNKNVEVENLADKLRKRPNFLIIMVDEERYSPPTDYMNMGLMVG